MGYPPSDGQATAAPLIENTEVNFLNAKSWLPGRPAVTDLKDTLSIADVLRGKFKSKEEEKVSPILHEGIDWSQKQNMGMNEHPFSSPTAVIPRVFRFTVETAKDTNFQYAVEKLEIDWVGKKITVSLYETAEFSTDTVIRSYHSSKEDSPITVKLYDGMGNPIMAYRFNGLAVHTYSTPLDYSSSNVLTSKVLFTYKTVDRIKRPTK